MIAPAIDVRGLDFRYPGGDLVLRGVTLAVPAGARCVLVGANGAGKTTLLGILAGKHLIPDGAAEVLGRPAFSDSSLGLHVTFVRASFPLHADIAVSEMLAARPDAHPERRRRLLDGLAIDPAWRMSRVSDGQRRRVQLLVALLAPRSVVLLDEVTSDLDVLARSELLAFLREDSEARGATILYATHVLDGIEDFATHVAWLDAGALKLMSPLADLEALRGTTLRRLVETWLRSVPRKRV